MTRYIDISPYEDCKMVLHAEDSGVFVKDIPTADVVEAVRCKDCIFCEDFGMSGLFCNHPDDRNPVGCRPDDFCSDGERKDGET